MGIITLLISLVFSCNFISSTITTNYLSMHPTCLSMPTPKIYPKKDINPLFTFNDNYIASYHANNTPVMINVKIGTNDLNLGNQIYWAYDGGIMGMGLPFKWTYTFDTNIPNSATTQAINLSNIGYDDNYQAIRLVSLVNLNQFNTFVNDFFNDATIKLPYHMLIACKPYSSVSNYITLPGHYYIHNPGVTFSKWITYKLFSAPVFNIIGSKLWNVAFPITSNKLFLDMNLTSCQNTYSYKLFFVKQLDRYMLSQGPINFNYQPAYSDPVIGNIQLNITGLMPNYYCFNPQDLFEINAPNDLTTNQWAYTSFPTLKFSVNNYLLTAFYDANLIAQLVNIINEYAAKVHNQTLLNLNNELWTKDLWSKYLATQIFSLVNNSETYNQATNTLALNLNKNLAVQSLINYLQLTLTKNHLAWWNFYLRRLSGVNTSLNLTTTNCINLYQTLLNTYQHSTIKYTLSTQKSVITYSLTYQNLSIALNANNCSKYVLPYDYYYEILNAEFILGNYRQWWDYSQEEFDILKYPQVINNYQINLPNSNLIKTSSVGIGIFPLQLFKQIPSLTLFNLEQTYHLTSSELTKTINVFNANYDSSVNTFNNYLNNKLTNSLIDLAIYHTFFSFFGGNESIISYCNQYGFDNNLLANSNNSLLSDFNVQVVNAKKGIYSVTFNMNNLVDFIPLIAARCFYVPTLMQLQDYASTLKGFFYLSPSLLNPPPPVKKNTVNPTSIPSPVKVISPPVKKITSPPTPIKKVDIPPTKVKKVIVKPAPKPIVVHHIQKKMLPKPIVIPTPIAKPIVVNNQPSVLKATVIPSWGYFLIVLPIVLVILGIALFFTYLKVKALIAKKKQKG